MNTPSLILRPYQQQALQNQTSGLEVWMWGRQTGKSFTLACWAVERLLTRPGRLVTILSNSVANGAELNQKCAQIARLYQQFLGRADTPDQWQIDLNSRSERYTRGNNLEADLGGQNAQSSMLNETLDLQFDCLVRETRITVAGKTGRIKILPANPRTAPWFLRRPHPR